ncbi:MAG: T9SS type A sorting domain-containing protein [bacterium]|nr:MAG: T9SS type A sorting domain-containing protein [bacterium]
MDLLVMCDLDPMDPPYRVAVPIENDDGSDADLYIVDIETGELLAWAEDPGVNPGLTILGYEIGVDLIRWTTFAFAVPLEYDGTGFDPGIVIMHPDGVAADSYFGANFLGYQRSVDPIVAPVEPPALIVPIGTDNASDADIVVFTAPPTLLVGYSFETVNDPLRMSRFYWDVDLGLIDKTEPGELYLCVPEEEPGGGDARLRFELTAGLPGDRVMAIATAGVGALPATLYLADVPTGSIILELNDLLGLETGLDMVTGNGPVTPGDMPVFWWPTGIDRDPDPTLVWEGGIVGIHEDIPKFARAYLDNSFPNPFNPVTTIRYGIEKRTRVSLRIYNVAGQLVKTLVDEIQTPRPEGFTVMWNGLNDNGHPVSNGVYFYRLVTGDFAKTKKMVLLK